MTAGTPLALEPAALFAERIFDGVRAATFDGVGITRASYGEGEELAMKLIENFARAEGLLAERDAGQNLVVRMPVEAEGKKILIGSHLDSVPRGGNFDGLAGVIAGLLLLRHYQREGIVPARPVRVLALRGEESAWFGKAYMGSLGLTGGLSAEDLALKHRDSGETLGAAMAKLGIPVERVARGEALIELSDIAAYLEVHIEQGPVMVARNWPVAAVTGIRGNIRHNRVVCRGEAGHSGAVPRWLRKDAVIAMADLVARLDEHWRVLQQMGLDLVVTFGIVSTNPASHAISVIPGEATFSFEVRSQNGDTLEQFYNLMRTECTEIEKQRGVAFEFDRKLRSEPATMAADWVQRFTDSGTAAGLKIEPIASGAGHDAAVFANAGVPSAMLFVRNDHGSHNPHEAMEMADFILAVDVLHRAIESAQVAP